MREKNMAAQIWSVENVENIIKQGRFIDKVGSVDKLPQPQKVIRELDEKLSICKDRSSRLILVEKLGDYMVFIAVPAGKSNCDFIVWRYSPGLRGEQPLIIPSHDYLGRKFIELKGKNEVIDEYLINATLRLVRDRMSISEIMQRYFAGLSTALKEEIEKFLITLKWVALQEDVNYPPPRYLGSKMVLAVFALLEVGFKPSELRRVIRF
ncbi:MAG: hypothetical protein LM590_15220 [Thermofilum sp.]|nr:hypothetical protein [Thermofilum sp.]